MAKRLTDAEDHRNWERGDRADRDDHRERRDFLRGDFSRGWSSITRLQGHVARGAELAGVLQPPVKV